MKLFRISKRARATRDKIIADCWFLIDHAAQIHYDQRRPYDLTFQSLPWTADCSGSTIAVYSDARAPDPSGLGFNGYGNTDTILAHLRMAGEQIPSRQARRGDLVLFHVGNDGRHVCILLESPRWHRDPWTCSHGGEYGPLHVPLSTEVRYHSECTVTFLRGVPVHY